MIQLCKRDCPRRRPGCQDGCPLLAAQLRHNKAEQQHLRANKERLFESIQGCVEQLPASRRNSHNFKKTEKTRKRWK